MMFFPEAYLPDRLMPAFVLVNEGTWFGIRSSGSAARGKRQSSVQIPPAPTLPRRTLEASQTLVLRESFDTTGDLERS